MSHPNLAAALIAAQQEFGAITKDKKAKIETKTGGGFAYTYADLGSVLDAVMPALHTHGLTISQILDALYLPNATVPGLRTVLMHADSGEKIEGTVPLGNLDMSDMRKVGSAITYARRYAIMAILTLNAEDDDGAAASQATTRRVPDTEPSPDVVVHRNPIRPEVRNGKDTDEIKTNLIKSIMIIAGKIGKTDDEIREAMRTAYRPNWPEQTRFSRKDLHVDELTEFLDKMKAREKRVLAQRGRA
jgi:hypothetical protein